MKVSAKYEKEFKELKADAEKQLIGRLLPFWSGIADYENGGFIGAVSKDLEKDPSAVKGGILNSRILWFFSNAYDVLSKNGSIDEKHRKELLALSGHAFAFLKKAFLDSKHGGIYWSVDPKGLPADDTKHTYCQAFAIYGLSSYYGITKDSEALNMAMKLFSLIEANCRDDGGYLEAFSRDFRPASNEKLSENGVIASRTMNTLLHVFEGYEELYRVSGEDSVLKKLKEIVEIFLAKVYNSEKQRQEVFFDHEYNSLLDLTSYGHDIESAWLFDEGVRIMGDSDIIHRMNPVTLSLARQVKRDAFDGHSLPAECEDGKVKQTRNWWSQAETVNGFLNAGQRLLEEPSAEEHPGEADEFFAAAFSEYSYIHENFLDNRPGGEWHEEVDSDGKPIAVNGVGDPCMTAGIWKCPYHNGRMYLEIMKRV